MSTQMCYSSWDLRKLSSVFHNEPDFALHNIVSVCYVLLHVLSYLIFTTTLGGKVYYCPRYRWGNSSIRGEQFAHSQLSGRARIWPQVVWPDSLLPSVIRQIHEYLPGAGHKERRAPAHMEFTVYGNDKHWTITSRQRKRTECYGSSDLVPTTQARVRSM